MEKKTLELGIAFHGHKCPAMPLGIRAGEAALHALGVPKASNKELFCLAEIGPAHAMACFGDGVQIATGCTFGKGNIEKLNLGKTAFTLIDVASKREVRVAVRPDFQAKAMDSDFVKLRKQGIEPKDIDPEITDPAVERILSLPEDSLFVVGPVRDSLWAPPKGTFEWQLCDDCGELTFATGLSNQANRTLCEKCAGAEKVAPEAPDKP